MMRYQPIPVQEGRAKPPAYKIMSAQEAIAKFIHEECYLGMTVSAAPASLIWEIVRQRDRIKTLDLVITSQIGMSSALIGSGLPIDEALDALAEGSDARSRGQLIALRARVVLASPGGERTLALAQLPRLQGCEVHTSVILSAVDENVFRRLGVNLTCDPKYQTRKLYHG